MKNEQLTNWLAYYLQPDFVELTDLGNLWRGIFSLMFFGLESIPIDVFLFFCALHSSDLASAVLAINREANKPTKAVGSVRVGARASPSRHKQNTRIFRLATIVNIIRCEFEAT